MAAELRLVVPDTAYVASYREALERGWSPDEEGDASFFLEHLLQDERLHLDISRGRVWSHDGSPRLDGVIFRWLWDGQFCGSIGLRPCSEDDVVFDGFVGYKVVPWKQRLGYATRALVLMKVEALLAGYPKLVLTCDEGNLASAKVIRANGGVLEKVEKGIEHYLITL